MEVKQIRISKTKKSVYGILMVVDGNRVIKVWKTIENIKKIFPIGTYKLVYEYSPKFGRYLWELYGIRGRSEIKIHVANYEFQLDGCIGIGLSHQDIDMDGDIDLAQSAIALAEFHQIMGHLKQSKITVHDLT